MRPTILARLLPVIGLAGSAVACSEAVPTAPVVEQRVVVHAILDPQNAEQIVLVERTQDGAAPSSAPRNPLDPIVSSGGSPISQARVIVFGPGTDSTVAIEDRAVRSDGTGAGVYRIASRAVANRAESVPAGVLRLVPGAAYRLRVDTPLGTVRGSTRLPRFNLAVTRGLRPFNLDVDTLRRPAVTGDGGAPAAYLLRHQMPGIVNRERLQSDSNDLLLAPTPTSDDRSWSFGFSRRDIRPGVAQRFVVVAVDSNFYEYRAGGYDPFGHDARGNRLDGGVGVFGAVATVVDANLDLIATRDHDIEGEWGLTVTSTVLPVSFRLYESPRFPGPAGTPGLHLWGTARMAGGDVLIAEATQTGETLQFSMSLPGSTQVRRLTGTFDGTVLTLGPVGSTLRLRYENRTAAAGP